MANVSVAKLSQFIDIGLNIIIRGQGGTGKTQMLMEATKKSGLNMEYMSAPTLDPYIDLIGAPVPSEPDENGERVLDFIRKKGLNHAEVIFIDELNRAEPKTLNAIFELVQFGSINGEKLKNLKCVVAAINPVEEGYVGNYDLDFSLLDRFDASFETDTAADPAYFMNVFGKDVGKALVTWHNNHDHKEKGYLSPRRLEKIGHTWLKIQELSTVKALMPTGGVFNVTNLHESLLKAVNGDKFLADDKASLAKKVPFMSEDEIRARREDIVKELPTMTPSEVAVVTEASARALKAGIRVPTIIRDWKEVLEYFSPTDKISMMSDWPASRNSQFQKLIIEEKIVIGRNLIKPAA